MTRQAPLVLFYGIQGQRLEAWKQLADQAGFLLRPVGDEEMDETIESLMAKGQMAALDCPAMTFEKPMEHALFVGLSGQALSDFLDACQERGLYIPLKAGLTDTNRTWPYRKLIEENAKEDAFMKRFRMASQAFSLAEEVLKEAPDAELSRLKKEMGAFLEDPKEEQVAFFDQLYPRFMSRLEAVLGARKEG